MMGWGTDMYGWGGHGFGGIVMILFWVLVIVGLIMLVRSIVSRPGTAGESGRHETPLEILQRRYAKGEIDKVEFEEKKKAIQG